MRAKDICYFIRAGVNSFRAFPSTLAAAIAEPIGVRILWPSEIRRGIRVVDPFPTTRSDFVSAVDAALALTAARDTLRFSRIVREIRTVINMPVLGASAAYSRRYKTCRLDLKSLPLTEDRATVTALLACLLVHEATHGHLSSRRLLQDRRNFDRIERLCWNEEFRFSRKIGFDLARWRPFPDGGRPPEAADVNKFAIEQAKRMWRS